MLGQHTIRSPRRIILGLLGQYLFLPFVYDVKCYYPFKDEAQTALFKDPVRTAL
jgi:hypothetical protein